MFRHGEEMSSQLRDDDEAVLRSAMFQNKLDNIVSKLILHQVAAKLVQFLKKWTGLFLIQVFKTSLQNSTAIGVRGELENMASECTYETKKTVDMMLCLVHLHDSHSHP